MKKIFYNKRHKLPIWSQIYVVWAIVFIICLSWVYGFGTVKSGTSDNGKFDYKKEADLINQSYQSSLYLFQNSSLYSPEEINRAKSVMNPRKWEVEHLKYNIRNARCELVRYYPQKQDLQLTILFDQGSLKSQVRLLHTFGEALVRKNISGVSVAAFRGNPVCADYAIEKKLLGNTSSSGVLLVYPSKSNKSGIQTAFPGGSSSIAWSQIIPGSEERPGLVNQAGHLVLPWFGKTFQKNPAGNILGWHFPSALYESEIDSINFMMPGILYTAASFSQIRVSSNFLWLGANKAISVSGMWVLTVALLILVWLPVINSLYLQDSIRNFPSSIVSGIFSSLVFFILLGGLRLFSIFMPESIYGTLIVLLVGALLFYFSGKLHKNMFSIPVNLITEFLSLVLYASAIAFLNPVLFAMLLPVIMISSRKAELNHGVYLFFLLVFLSPVFYLLGLMLQDYGVNSSFSLLVLDTASFSHVGQTLAVILLAGSLIAMIRHREVK